PARSGRAGLGGPRTGVAGGGGADGPPGSAPDSSATRSSAPATAAVGGDVASRSRSQSAMNTITAITSDTISSIPAVARAVRVRSFKVPPIDHLAGLTRSSSGAPAQQAVQSSPLVTGRA